MNLQTERRFFLVFLLATVVIFLITVFFVGNFFETGRFLSPSEYSYIVTKKCGNVGTENGFESRMNCYVEELRVATANYGFKYANDVFQVSKNSEAIITNCHLIAHAISYQAVINSPDKWFEIASTMNPNNCGGGYIHGAIEGYYSSVKEPLNPGKLSDACLKFDPYLRDMCYHVVGHLLLVEKSADVGGSIKSCQEFAIPDDPDESNKYECYSGAFMENILRDNLSEHKISDRLVFNEANHEKIDSLCLFYSGEIADSCWREAVHFYLSLYDYDPVKVFEACNKALSNKFRMSCSVHGVGWLMADFVANDKKDKKICKSNPSLGGFEKECALYIAGLVQFEPKKAARMIQFCQQFSVEIGTACVEKVNSLKEYKDPYDSKLDDFCSVDKGLKIPCLGN